MTKEDIFKDDSDDDVKDHDSKHDEKLRSLSTMTKQELDIFKDDSDESVEDTQHQQVEVSEDILQIVEMNEKMNEACSKKQSLLS